MTALKQEKTVTFFPQSLTWAQQLISYAESQALAQTYQITICIFHKIPDGSCAHSCFRRNALEISFHSL